MLSPLTRQAAPTERAAGTVEVELPVKGSPTDVWRALTEPTEVALWFGALSSTPRLGAHLRLEFGDGDFFDLTVLRADPPHLLQYTWRFLGIGPLAMITWRVAEELNGCRVSVEDADLRRSRAAALELRDGWLDFVGRLQRYLATKESARYEVRSTFEGGVQLPRGPRDAWAQLFAPEAQRTWLPLDKPVLETGARFVGADASGTIAAHVAAAWWQAPERVAFLLYNGQWARPMECTLGVKPYGSGALLEVAHEGWEEAIASVDRRLRHRRLFSQLWIEALQRARRRLSELQR
jgi:uncharacterized protein YndB with AHSA1/START domain